MIEIDQFSYENNDIPSKIYEKLSEKTKVVVQENGREIKKQQDIVLLLRHENHIIEGCMRKIDRVK